MTHKLLVRTAAAVAVLSLFALRAPSLRAQSVDWAKVSDNAIQTLQDYIRIDTSNPPGNTSKTADFLTAIFQREGIPVERYESAPGKVIIVARLKGSGAHKAILLENHMDVVPADKSRWPHDPFGGQLIDGEIWGRGSVDMKGLGVIQLYAFLELKRQHVPLDRDVIFMAVPDEEVGGDLGARWMIEHHYAELDPAYVLDEGGMGSRDLFAKGKLVFGISVAEKKIVWLRLRAEGVAGHGSEPHDQNPNDKLVKALARLVSSPMPSGDVTVVKTLEAKAGTLATNKFVNAITHTTYSLTTLRAGVGEPPKINVIPSVAEAGLDCRLLPGVTKEAWLADLRRRLAESVDQDRGDLRVGRFRGVVAGHAALQGARRRHRAAPPGRHRVADPRALRHRLERLPPEGRQQLRHLPGRAAGRDRVLDARRRRAAARRPARDRHPDHVRGLEGHGEVGATRRVALAADG